MLLTLRPERLTAEALRRLEERDLVRSLRPTEKIAASPSNDGEEDIYNSEPRFGAHKLLCVRKKVSEVTLWIHSDNEDVVFLNPERREFDRLILVVGLHKEKEFARLAREGKLTEKDVVALEVEFNDPATAFFTILKHTPHTEVTLPRSGEAPIFYVTEPTQLDMYAQDVGDYKFEVAAR